jgi:hypothetical protein
MKRNILFLIFASISLVVSLGYTEALSEKTREEQLVDRFLDREKDVYKFLSQTFKAGDGIAPVLLSRLKEVLKRLDEGNEYYGKAIQLSGALIHFEDGGPKEFIDLLFDLSHLNFLRLARERSCLHLANIDDPRCQPYLRRFEDSYVLAGRLEYLQTLQEQKDNLGMASPKQVPYPQRNFDRAILEIEGAMDWLKRSSPEFIQPAGMPDEEAIRELILEYLVTFERHTPWLILEDSEKEKPVKPGHRVSYFQRDEEAMPVYRVIEKVWSAEKMIPIDLRFNVLAINPDHTRALVLIDYVHYDSPNRRDGNTFVFWKINGHWQFRLAEKYLVAIS